MKYFLRMKKIEEIYSCFLKSKGVSTDTRVLQKNQMFFCLKGPNFNANQFAKKVIDEGASFVVVDDESYYEEHNPQYILVEDVLQALQQLATYHRQQSQVVVISLTGSNGKTTTKELIATVLSSKYKTIATIGNLNNHIGVPLSLLRIQPDTEIAVIEMGANHQKEIQMLAEIAHPDYGYITNFGKAHLEGFGGVEGVIRGKSELYNYLKAYNKTAFVNVDDSIQVEKSEGISSVSFSVSGSTNANYSFHLESKNDLVQLVGNDFRVNSQLTGLYNGINIAAAVTIGLHLGVDMVHIQKAIETYCPTNNRSQWTTFGKNQVLLDAYNANPSSMQLAIRSFAQQNKPNALMILGDMFELGEYADEEHSKIIELVASTFITTHFIGAQFYRNKLEHPRLFFYETVQDFIAKVQLHLLSQQTILIKGSRGMALEKLLEK